MSARIPGTGGRNIFTTCVLVWSKHNKLMPASSSIAAGWATISCNQPLQALMCQKQPIRSVLAILGRTHNKHGTPRASELCRTAHRGRSSAHLGVRAIVTVCEPLRTRRDQLEHGTVIWKRPPPVAFRACSILIIPSWSFRVLLFPLSRFAQLAQVRTKIVKR
jgi:hypothetical protein